MKLIIAGSRSFNDMDVLQASIEDFNVDPTEVVSGTARGADRLGEQWAVKNQVAIKRFPAEWDTHGKSAGYIRNSEMAKYGDALLAFWDGESRGTKHMIDLANKEGIQVFTVMIGEMK